MRTRPARAPVVVLSVAATSAARAQAPGIPHPTDWFGFEIGTDGELARYPRILARRGVDGHVASSST